MDEPLAEVGAAGPAGRNSSAVGVRLHRSAVDCAPRNEGVEIIRGLGAATVQAAVVAAAKLGALGRINPPKPDPRSVDFQGVTVDDTGLADQVFGEGRARK